MVIGTAELFACEVTMTDHPTLDPHSVAFPQNRSCPYHPPTV